MNIAVICRILGLVLEVEAAFMTPALGIGLYKGEWAGVAGLSATMAALLLSGLIAKETKHYLWENRLDEDSGEEPPIL